MNIVLGGVNELVLLEIRTLGNSITLEKHTPFPLLVMLAFRRTYTATGSVGSSACSPFTAVHKSRSALLSSEASTLIFAVGEVLSNTV